MKKNTYSSEYKSFSKRPREARRELNLTQKEVAEKLGETQSYISKIEKSMIYTCKIQKQILINLKNQELIFNAFYMTFKIVKIQILTI